MWRLLENVNRAFWWGWQLDEEPTISRIVPTDEPLEPVTSPMIPPQPSSEPTPEVAPSQPLPEPAPVNGQWAPQILCGSSHNSFGSLAITTVQGNMIIHQSDYDELRRAVAEIRRSIPAIVRHSNENALVLTDALGETLTVPWSFVPTYEELNRLLVNHFRGKLGEKRVAEGRYCIGRAEGPDNGLVVKDKDWKSIRDQHEQLVMSMLIEQKWEWDSGEIRMCPKCGRTELGTYVDQGWRVCRRCRTRYILPTDLKLVDEVPAKVEDLEEVLQFRHVRKQPVEPLSIYSLNWREQARSVSRFEELAD
ncbi:hypothetical protein DFP72DRAFT_1047354 [Ephemerocybe angulata]|uniref:Ubiquitin-like domain-containing protein n=1 Tax=Ephemerocybe angulata TaxID=980116 RepID=A0A8H6HT49_9AGAR|nr:hypothetical protein DFP72DRAFT_1047354 [Tulosesus angulatus]